MRIYNGRICIYVLYMGNCAGWTPHTSVSHCAAVMMGMMMAVMMIIIMQSQRGR